MKVIILAAGYGTRLMPLTKDKPKALLEIGGNTILGHILDKIPEDISRINLVTNARYYGQFKKWIEENKKDINLINDGTTSEQNRLGALRDLKLVLDNTLEDDALVIASDNLFDFSLYHACGDFEENGADSVVLFKLNDKQKARSFGVVLLDDKGFIKEFAEKPAQPKSDLISTGIYFFTKESLKMINDYLKTNPSDAPGHFVEWLAKRRKVRGCLATGRWYDIGNINSYKEAREFLG